MELTKEHKEVWKKIKGYEGIYEISSHGNIKSCSRLDILGHNRKEKILKNGYTTTKYHMVILRKNNRIKAHRVHTLVGNHFISNPHNKPQINHKDFNRTNNYIENLEWVTQKENIRHAWDNGACTNPSGEKNGMNKLTEKQIIDIRKIGKAKTLLEISKIYNISFQHVGAILNNKLWKHLK